MATSFEYQSILRAELARRCERNASYSLRSFARALTVDPAALSRILSGKQIPSPKIAAKISSALNHDPKEQRAFLDSAKKHKRVLATENANTQAPARAFDSSIELFRILSDWYHSAILELTFTRDFKSDARWIGAQLGISPSEARLAIDRLLEAGLLSRQGERLVKTQASITTADKSLTTPALRKHQKQLLEKAIESLEADPIDERSHTSMTMSIAPKNLPLARSLIDEFSRRICEVLEDGEQTRTYNLSVALFPVQKKRKNRRQENE
jgi:uncharacterized protein (TIGR02147 family)